MCVGERATNIKLRYLKSKNIFVQLKGLDAVRNFSEMTKIPVILLDDSAVHEGYNRQQYLSLVSSKKTDNIAKIAFCTMPLPPVGVPPPRLTDKNSFWAPKHHFSGLI